MHRIATLTAAFVLPLLTLPATASQQPPPLFYCTTDEGDTVTLVEQDDRLALHINNHRYLSTETTQALKADYIQQTDKDPEYKVILFHSGKYRIYAGTSRTPRRKTYLTAEQLSTKKMTDIPPTTFAHRVMLKTILIHGHQEAKPLKR